MTILSNINLEDYTTPEAKVGGAGDLGQAE